MEKDNFSIEFGNSKVHPINCINEDENNSILFIPSATIIGNFLSLIFLTSLIGENCP